MDFGRTKSVDKVRFDLPAEDPRSAPILAAPPAAQKGIVRIGAPAWASSGFARKVYPKGTKAGDYLAAYARHYNAIELNATFHRVPDGATIAGWLGATTDSFRFCPKVHKTVTESLDESAGKRFFDAISKFDARLGPVLLQMGPAFSPSRLADLERFLDAMPPMHIAVEVRQAKWFEGGRLIEPAFQAFSSRGVTAVITDVSGRRDVCHASLTTRTAFVRFAGNELHPSDTTRVEAWSARIASWVERGVTDAYVFVHQPDDVLAPETLAMFAQRFEREHGLVAIAPAGPLFA